MNSLETAVSARLIHGVIFWHVLQLSIGFLVDGDSVFFEL